MEPIEIVGLCAGGLTALSYLPQAMHTYQTKSSRDLSWWMLGLYVVAVVLWLWYGFGISSMPIMLSNAVLFLFVLSVCAMKYIYDAKKPGKKR